MANGTIEVDPGALQQSAPQQSQSIEVDPQELQQGASAPAQAPAQPTGTRAAQLVHGGIEFLKDVHGGKTFPFEEDVARGMGFDPDRIKAAGGIAAQWKELGSQMLTGIKNWGISTAKDPIHLADPIDTMASNLEKGISSGKPGQIVGALSSIAAGIKAPDAAEGAAGVVGKTRDIGTAMDKTGLLQSSHAVLNSVADGAAQELVKAKSNVGMRIGALVRPISDADVAESASRGQIGTIKVPEAYQEMVKAIQKYDPATMATAKGKVAAAAKGMSEVSSPVGIPWETGKSLRTDIGALMEDSKIPTEKAVLGAVYQNLTEQLALRANVLGFSDHWRAYNELNTIKESYMRGPLGKLLKAESGAQFFETLKGIDPDTRAALQTDLSKFGLPSTFFNDLLKSNKNTLRLIRNAGGGSAGYVGKIKAFKEHPIAAGSAALVAGAAAAPLGVGKFIASLMAAGAAADLADRVSAATEIRKRGGAPVQGGRFGAAADVVPR